MKHLDAGVSYWHDSEPDGDRSGVSLPPEADVVVVGGGIAGLTTTYLLTQAGRTVALLEARRLAGGVSGSTTAKVSAQHGAKYARLARSYGSQTAADYAASNIAALEWIADEQRTLGVDCQFERKDSYVFTAEPGQASQLADEATAAAEAGLAATTVSGDIGLPISPVDAVRFTDQAQFHPRRWLLALADRAESAGCHIVEGARVLQVAETDFGLIVRSSRGSVRARDVVIATHYPILDRGLYFARLAPTHDLVVAAEVDEPLPGIYLAIDTGHSVRTTPLDNGKHLLLVLGEHYRTGDDVDVSARYERMTDWAQRWFGIGEPDYRWSAHDLATPDALPYIGHYHPLVNHLWVATGFAQWGMTGGTLAGMLLRDLITGVDNPLAHLYSPNRLLGPRAVRAIGKANLQTARHAVVGHVKALIHRKHPHQLEVGESTVTTVGTSMVAAYRDSDAVLHAVSARCTHLGCVVAFNNAEKTWDCPCHASRFDLDGSVLNGPAVKPLEPTSLDQEQLDITDTERPPPAPS
ncbi:MAG: FAD-dependent oxidoreductase [Haloechinothrix sp.]